MNKLTNFLVTLGTHPEQARAFQQDPIAIMQQAGLTVAEMEVIISQNLGQIQATTGGLWDKLIAKGVLVLEPESDGGNEADTADDKD